MIKVGIKTTFLCSVERIWRMVADFENQEWRTKLDRLEILDENTFLEYAEDGLKTTVTIVEMILEEYIELFIDNEQYSGKWTCDLSVTGELTTLYFEEHIKSKNILNNMKLSKQLVHELEKYAEDLRNVLGCEVARV